MHLPKITPFSLIGSVMTLAAFIGLVYSVDGRYITKAEASEQTSQVVQRQQFDRVETDLALVNLEIGFLRSQIEDDEADDDVLDRLEYLKARRMILENYLLELKSAK